MNVTQTFVHRLGRTTVRITLGHSQFSGSAFCKIVEEEPAPFSPGRFAMEFGDTPLQALKWATRVWTGQMRPERS